jgi:hypothetical protein
MRAGWTLTPILAVLLHPRSACADPPFRSLQATVDVVAGDSAEPLRLHVGTDAGWAPVCTSPCRAELPLGVPLRLAVSRGDGSPTPAPGSLVLGAPSRLDLRYESHRTERAFGWGLLLGGPVVGALVIASAPAESGCAADSESGCYSRSPGLALPAGAVIAIGGVIGGLALLFNYGDDASVRVDPLAGAMPSARSPNRRQASPVSTAIGGSSAVVLRF